MSGPFRTPEYPRRAPGEEPVAVEDLQPVEHALGAAQEARAANIERLGADIDLYNRLKFAEYHGREYEAFRKALTEYALPIMIAWSRSGEIFKRCADKRRRVGGCAIPWEAAPDLAADTIVVALRRFKEDVLIPHRWDPGQGASLRTYFIGACILAFPNVYRKWQIGESANVLSAASETDPDVLIDTRRFRDPHLMVELSEAVEAVGEPTANLLAATVRGLSHEEIGREEGVSAKAIEMRVRRRKRIR